MENNIKVELFGGNSGYISPISNPFNKDYIYRICLTAIRSKFEERFMIYGTVEFKNGNTKGEQQFEANSLPELFIKIKEFVEQI